MGMQGWKKGKSLFKRLLQKITVRGTDNSTSDVAVRMKKNSWIFELVRSQTRQSLVIDCVWGEGEGDKDAVYISW